MMDCCALSPDATVATGDPYILREQDWPPTMGAYVICPAGALTVAQMLESLGWPSDTAVRDVVWGPEANGADGAYIAYSVDGVVNLRFLNS
jgi:hypothetical protein